MLLLKLKLYSSFILLERLLVTGQIFTTLERISNSFLFNSTGKLISNISLSILLNGTLVIILLAVMFIPSKLTPNSFALIPMIVDTHEAIEAATKSVGDI